MGRFPQPKVLDYSMGRLLPMRARSSIHQRFALSDGLPAGLRQAAEGAGLADGEDPVDNLARPERCLDEISAGFNALRVSASL